MNRLMDILLGGAVAGLISGLMVSRYINIPPVKKNNHHPEKGSKNNKHKKNHP